jgi:hypothetical protein
MTSSAQPRKCRRCDPGCSLTFAEDVVSYLQSGMNDILAKPFTKHGLFGILDKHLLHMKVLQLSAEVPRPVGNPPLSDQGVQEAVAQGAALASGLLNWGQQDVPNPLAGMGWSDDTYQLVLDVSCISDLHTIAGTDVISNSYGRGLCLTRQPSISLLVNPLSRARPTIYRSLKCSPQSLPNRAIIPV